MLKERRDYFKYMTVFCLDLMLDVIYDELNYYKTRSKCSSRLRIDLVSRAIEKEEVPLRGRDCVFRNAFST